MTMSILRLSLILLLLSSGTWAWNNSFDDLQVTDFAQVEGLLTVESISALNNSTGGWISGPFKATSSGTEVGLSLINTGTGGRSYSIFSTNNSSQGGGGNLMFADATAQAYRLTINASGNISAGGNITAGSLSGEGSGISGITYSSGSGTAETATNVVNAITSISSRGASLLIGDLSIEAGANVTIEQLGDTIYVTAGYGGGTFNDADAHNFVNPANSYTGTLTGVTTAEDLSVTNSTKVMAYTGDSQIISGTNWQKVLVSGNAIYGFDTLGEVANSTFTAQNTGYYLVVAHIDGFVFMPNLTTTEATITIYKNNTEWGFPYFRSETQGGGFTRCLNMSGIIYLTAGNTLNLYISSNSGAGQIQGYHNFLGITRLY